MLAFSKTIESQMPRASNRVGVEVDGNPGGAALSADLLKAKKAERRARAKQRAEEKKLKSKQQTPEQEGGEVEAAPADRAHGRNNRSKHSSRDQGEAESTLHGRNEKLDMQEDDDAGMSGSSTQSSLQQASAEHGTEEVINVDAFVARMSLEQQQQQLPSSPESTQKKHVKRSPTQKTADAAAFKIQKALKKKFVKKTLKKCTSFLRHSSKVFAEVDLSPSTDHPAETSPSLATDDSLASSSKQHSPRLPPYHSQADASPETPVERSSHDKSSGASRDTRQTRHRKRDDQRASSSSESSRRDDASSGQEEHEARHARRSSDRAEIPTSPSSSRSSESLSDTSSSSSTSSSSDKESRRKTKSIKTSKNDANKKNKKRSSPSTKALDSSEVTSADEAPGSIALVGPTSTLLQGLDIHSAAERMGTSDLSARRYREIHHETAIKIQAWVRGVEGRRLAHVRRVELEREIEREALREVHEEASVRIQAMVKGYLTRRQLGVVDNSLCANKKSNKDKKKKNRRASVTAFFKGEDVAEEEHARPPPESPEKSGFFEEDVSRSSIGRKNSEDDVAEWPTEFNLEGLDDWEELNSKSNVYGDLVTHTHFLSKSKLRVFCGTWNMHAKKPQDDLRLWIPLNKYHIVAVGSEECVNSIAKSVVFTSKKQWEDLLKDTLGEEYVLVSSHSLTAIHNIVFVHESVLPLLSNIQSDAVATGLGNQLGNKGGVGIAFSIGRTSFAFVNCHFDAHQQNTDKRNGNFHRINQELKLFPSQNPLAPPSSAITGVSSLDGLGRTTATRFSASSSSSSSTMPPVGIAGKKLAISECFDRVFWFGDLNYRINGTRKMVDLLLLHNKYEVLRFNDQLQIEMAKGNVFAHFQEGPLHFRPTYKFDKHSNVYDSSGKQRIPSWTDRILYLSNEKAHDVEILSYRSQMNFQTSDHRPVGATFHVNFKNPESAESSTEFSRVLARGYRASQAKSEVCAIQ